ncbi:hypothetical protein ACET3X_007894 [Alternaria dauci]|uniref:Alkaline protease 1 n=1 Tax=Alternaria dauci TaxID=48095 RepID=A0ABR3UER4_9PLEO
MQFFARITALAAAAAPFLADAAPVNTPRGAEIIPGKYIVQLKPDIDVASIAAHHNKVRSIHARNLARRGDGADGAPVEHEYGFGSFKAYAGSLDEATIEELKALPEVLTIEPDFVVRISEFVTQPNAPLSAAGISSRTPGATDYVYDDSAGDGTFSYVLDTGVRITHVDFEGRATHGFNAVAGSNATDVDGHGSHVAGTLGGATYGVAKKTNIINVKVMGDDGSGVASEVFAGFDWTVNDIVSKGRRNTAVINLSISSSASTLWDAAITASWEQGVIVVSAAGNEDGPADNSSPCRSLEVICVGNANINHIRHTGPGGSNYGPEVDIFGVGTNVLSASPRSDTASRITTGTSMASPAVAGLISYLRALEGPSTAAEIKARVYELATPDVVADTRGSVNLLAFNGNPSALR